MKISRYYRELNNQNALSDYVCNLRSEEENTLHASAGRNGSYRTLQVVADSSVEVLKTSEEFNKMFEEMFRTECLPVAVQG